MTSTGRLSGVVVAISGAIAAVAATPALSAPGRLGGGEQLGVSLGRIVVALLICISIAVLAVLLIRQRSGRGDLANLFSRFEPRAGAIHVVETRRISPHADICLVRHGNREYLLLLVAGAARIMSENPISAMPQVETQASCD